MKILAIKKEVPGLTSADFQPHLEAEAKRAWELTQSGVIREMHLRTDAYEAVIILECSDEQEARDALATLPLVKEGLILFLVVRLGRMTDFQYFSARTCRTRTEHRFEDIQPALCSFASRLLTGGLFYKLADAPFS